MIDPLDDWDISCYNTSCGSIELFRGIFPWWDNDFEVRWTDDVERGGKYVAYINTRGVHIVANSIEMNARRCQVCVTYE
jgi:hypothetical protein